jgi:phosphatidylglycerol:prolipoprotein diacylglycerol transferase
MYAVALTLAGGTTLATTGVPFFQLGSLGPIESFGVIVAAGVLIGAALLRRYAEWHGVDDEHIRGLTGWITVSGFLGAHLFDVLAYQWKDLVKDPILLVKIWAGISSYGGFLGGAIGFALYVWWKRLPVRLMADIALVGLLPAFSIGRIGCTSVSDHVGAAVADPGAWYSFLAMEYPRSAATNSNVAHLFQQRPDAGSHILAWNLGLVELVYLIPVNALVLWLAFRPVKTPPSGGRLPAGFIAVLVGILYAPVRFFLDYLRPETSDPRHFGLTFAQWSSILAFGVSVYVAARILKNGKPADTIARSSREAQEKIRVVLKDANEAATADAKGKAKAAGAGKAKAADGAAEKVGAKATEKAAEKATDEAAEKAAETESKTTEPASKAAEPESKPASAIVEEPADEGAEVDAKSIADAAKPGAAPAPAKKSGGGGAKNKKK